MARFYDLRVIYTPFVAAGAILVASCASVLSRPRTIPFPGADRAGFQRTGVITSYRQALDTVVSVMQNRLGFPPLLGTLDLYPDRASMVAALEGEGYEAPYARQIADHLDGVARPGHIIANDSVLRWEQWPTRIAFLAHEMTHVAEYALAAGRRGSSEQWLREGFAEWASWRVVDDLGLSSYGTRRRAALLHLRDACDHQTLPPFSELISQNAWVRSGKRQTVDLKYDQAFLAAELLVQLHGLPAVLEYFRLFAHSDDSPANFRAAFGEEPRYFEATFQARLQRLLR